MAETIPGPTTARLGEMSRKKNSYLVAGMYERDGAAIYNTAVLLDRTGAVGVMERCTCRAKKSQED